MHQDHLPEAASQKPKQFHVHPLIAWMAVFNFALVFSLAPTVILAQAPSPEMSSGSSAVATSIPESTKLAHAKMLAVESATKAPQRAEKKVSSPEAQCLRGCRITKLDCAQRAADAGLENLHACYVAAHACVAKCNADKTVKSTSTSSKTAVQSYEEAKKEALKSFQDGLKQLQSQYKTSLEKAKADYAAAKEAEKGVK